MKNSQGDTSEKSSKHPTELPNCCTICNCPIGAHNKRHGEIVLCDGTRIQENDSNDNKRDC
jgi:hypothetical protein